MHCVSARQGLSPYRLDHRPDTLLSMYVTVQTSTDPADILFLSLERNARLFVSKLGLPVRGNLIFINRKGNRHELGSSNWKQFTGKVKEQWGDLTDDELDQIAGKRDILVGKVQAKYGIAKEEAEKQFTD